jgi:hypothetical protein
MGRQFVHNRPQDLTSLTVRIEILNAHASDGKEYNKRAEWGAEWGFGKRNTQRGTATLCNLIGVSTALLDDG